jgi:hypothetical protein
MNKKVDAESKSAVGQWLNGLEGVLHKEAELAGLLEHGTMVGSAREFLVSRALRSVLPPSLHIGTGRVIDSCGNRSKQVDVVIYDPVFPILETHPGNGLYLVEGVVATIEVKSNVDKTKLWEAFDNCLSVTRLNMDRTKSPATLTLTGVGI